jgi:hypothetical protein
MATQVPKVSTSYWAVASASLLAALVALLLYQVLTGAITRTIATEVTGQDLDLEQSYRLDTLKADLQASTA